MTQGNVRVEVGEGWRNETPLTLRLLTGIAPVQFNQLAVIGSLSNSSAEAQSPAPSNATSSNQPPKEEKEKRPLAFVTLPNQMGY